MAQPQSWTDTLVARLTDAGLKVRPEAVEALGSVVDRGRTRLREDTRRELGQPDLSRFAEHVDALAARLVEVARENEVDTLDEGMISKLLSWLCPGFFPWC